MLKQILLSAALISVVVAETNSPREVAYPSMDPCRQGGCLAPVFDKGYFFQMKSHTGTPPNGYALWDPLGNPVYQIDIIAPDGTPGRLRQDAAIDTDGTAILPIWYGGYGGKGHIKGAGVVVVNSSGKQIQFIDTGRFVPAHVCFAQDHSIWVAGTQYAPLRAGDDIDHLQRGDFQMVRKYSRDGKLIGEFLSRSLFPAGLVPVETGWMAAATDRIGVLTHPGMVSNQPEWVELDLEGKLIGRWKVGPQFVVDPITNKQVYSLGRLAFTSDARLFAQPYDAECKKYKVLIFDRATSSWQPSDAAGSQSANSNLVGADGNNLAFQRRNDSVNIVWVTPQGR